MERLTSNNPIAESETMNLSLTDLYARLKAYEDAEEQGRLIVLPCKLGERVYKAYKTWFTMPICTSCIEYGCMKCCDYLSGNECTSKVEKGNDGATYGVISLMLDYSMIPEIGKTVFLLREEAEKALEGMK